MLKTCSLVLQHPGDAAFGGTTPATAVVYDFLTLLVDSLAVRGLHYVAAASDSTTDVELPAFTGLDAAGNPAFDDVRLTDRDAVLARADVAIANPQHGTYQAYIPVSFGAVQTGVFEGWAAVDATVQGRTSRFVATHLEAQLAVPVQVGQAQELLSLLQSETRPTILVGDFNSDVLGIVPGKATPSYGMITGAGFADSWLQPHQPDPGTTCCESVDLLNPLPTLDQRIDFIFTRNLAPLAIPLQRASSETRLATARPRASGPPITPVSSRRSCCRRWDRGGTPRRSLSDRTRRGAAPSLAATGAGGPPGYIGGTAGYAIVLRAVPRVPRSPVPAGSRAGSRFPRMIELELLGPVRISVNGAAPPAELLWRKNLALLMYLACSPKRSRTRDHLVGLLWPDKPEHASWRSLTVALSTIRQVVGDRCLETIADQVRLEAGTVKLDTDQFALLEAAGDWRAAAAMVSGAFAEGLAVPGATGFEEWLSGERRAWSGRAVDVLLRLAQAELDGGAQRSAAGVARRAVAIAPCGDAAVQMLMRALALDGDHAAALREYDEYASRLLTEIGTQPSAACSALADRIRRTPGVTGPRDRESPAARRRAPLVGRGAELERLIDGWRRGRDAGRAVATFLVGDAGVGKTRLAEELTSRMRFEGTAPAVIRAVASDLAIPWNGILGLARGGLLEAGGVPGAAPGALAWFAERIPEWADRFPAARRAAAETAPVRAVSDVLSAALAVQPVALVVDDAEQLDRDSLLALGAVLRDLDDRPLYVLCTSAGATARPELDELRARIGRDVRGDVVRVTALGSADIKTLAHWAVPDYGDAELERLTRRVSTDSAGLPLLVVELLSAVAAGLDLAKVHGAWPEAFRTLDQTLPGDLPEAVVGAIRVGFRRLSPAAQRQLQALAVLEGRVTVERLDRATGLGSAAVTGALDELEWNRWIVVDGRGYAFAARIVREVVKQDLVLPGQQRRLVEAAGPA